VAFNCESSPATVKSIEVCQSIGADLAVAAQYK
jgi:hypothetical protein